MSLFFVLISNLLDRLILSKKLDSNNFKQANLVNISFISKAWYWLAQACHSSSSKRLTSHSILSHLPFYLDMLALCLEAGMNLSNSLRLTVSKAPISQLHLAFEQVLVDIRTGQSWSSAWRKMAITLPLPEIQQLVALLVQAEQFGLALAPILHAQSDQCRQLYFAMTEKRALEAPVKMLIPLILFIFPCSFIVLAFPISYQLIAAWQ